VDRKVAGFSDLAEFAAGGVSRAASIYQPAYGQADHVHTAEQIISVVAVQTADRFAAAAIALAVVWEARSGARLRHPPAERTAMTDLVRWFVERGVMVALGARPVPQRHMARAPVWTVGTTALIMAADPAA
jgi:hypothetical protein